MGEKEGSEEADERIKLEIVILENIKAYYKVGL